MAKKVNSELSCRLDQCQVFEEGMLRVWYSDGGWTESKVREGLGREGVGCSWEG